MLITLLQRYYLWLFIALSGLCGLALGNLGATALGYLVKIENPPETRIANTPQEFAPRPKITDYKPILERNIFNSAARVEDFQPVAPSQPTQTAAPTRATNWTLVGTISGGKIPLAILKSGAEVETYHLAQELPDGARLTLIARNRVELTYPDGRVVQAELDPDNPAATPRQSSGAAARSRAGSTEAAQTRAAAALPEVEEVGENRWLIPEQTAEDARSNIGSLLGQAQAVPYLEGNKTTGFQIRMIQPNSLIAQLGLRQGDILREVNGLALDSPEKALQIFGQLRQAKQISIGLERRGKAMTFAYEIR